MAVAVSSCDERVCRVSHSIVEFNDVGLAWYGRANTVYCWYSIEFHLFLRDVVVGGTRGWAKV